MSRLSPASGERPVSASEPSAAPENEAIGSDFVGVADPAEYLRQLAALCTRTIDAALSARFATTADMRPGFPRDPEDAARSPEREESPAALAQNEHRGETP